MKVIAQQGGTERDTGLEGAGRLFGAMELFAVDSGGIFVGASMFQNFANYILEIPAVSSVISLPQESNFQKKNSETEDPTQRVFWQARCCCLGHRGWSASGVDARSVRDTWKMRGRG